MQSTSENDLPGVENNEQLRAGHCFMRMVDLIWIAPTTSSRQRKQSQHFEGTLHETWETGIGK